MRTERAAPRVAREILLAEEPQPFIWQGHSDLGSGFTPTHISWFLPPETTARVRRFRFDNTDLDAQWGVLFQGEQPICDSKYLIFDEQYDTLAIDPNRLIEQPQDRLFVLARNNGFNDPYHWLTQILPALEAGASDSAAAPSLALPPLQQWQQRSIELLGYARMPTLTLDPARHYRFPCIEFSEYLNGAASFAVSRLAKSAYERIARTVSGDAPIAGGAIYLKAAENRRTLANENELIDQLSRAGVPAISLEDLSFDDRVRMLRSARMIIGAHSSVLAYVVFSQPGALLYELFPSHYVNPCMNKLAQAAQMDYAADCFKTSQDNTDWAPGRAWNVDVGHVISRIDTFRQSGWKAGQRDQTSGSIRELTLAFESLGDNCEFGLVQRQAGAEPISLLRFASPAIPIEHRAHFIAEAIRNKFAGLGAPGTVHLTLEGKSGRREYIGRESVYHLLYHTFKIEGEIDPIQFAQSESRRLEFLGAKLMRDLQSGEKIWLWKSNLPTSPDLINGLLDALRSHGPNRLLWVALADEHHPHGTIEQVSPDLMKAYIDRLAPYDNAPNISFDSWVEICRKAKQVFDGAIAPSAQTRAPSASPPVAAISERCRATMKDCLRGWAPLIEISIATRGEQAFALGQEIREIFTSSGATVALDQALAGSEGPPTRLTVVLPRVPGTEALVACRALASSGLTPNIEIGEANDAASPITISVGG